MIKREESNFKEQYLLRVKAHSELEMAIQALQDGPMTDEELQELTGLTRTGWLIRQLDKWFDNISGKSGRGSDKTEISFVDVMPRNISVVTSDVNFAGDGSAPAQANAQESVVWQIAPPMLEKMENFDKPSWYENMRTMVEHGSHISLEGPPGVGKDTAVQQLAAEEGKVLVTIGGDGGFRRRDLVGTPRIAGGVSYLEAAEYVTAAVNGWWVLITEINAADPDALIYINSQLAPPYIVTVGGKSYPVHPNFRLFVSYNSGLIGTKPLPQSLKDRFFPIRVPFFNEYQLTRRLNAMGMPEPTIDDMNLQILEELDPDVSEQASRMGYSYSRTAWTENVVKFGIAMWDAHERGQMRYQVTTRRLYDAVRLMTIGGYTNVKKALKDAVISAIDATVEAKAAQRVLDEIVRMSEED